MSSEALKRPRGRPRKDPDAPKARYNLSTAEKARRATQAVYAVLRKRPKRNERRLINKYKELKKRESAAKKVETALQGKNSRVIDVGDLNALPDAVKKLVGESEVVFKPNDGPQEDFLSAPEQDVLYGGAAGGGKSFALLADPLRYCHNPNHRGLLLRRTLDELTELISKSKQLYPKAFPGASFRV